jgi:hypothetical protein
MEENHFNILIQRKLKFTIQKDLRKLNKKANTLNTVDTSAVTLPTIKFPRSQSTKLEEYITGCSQGPRQL